MEGLNQDPSKNNEPQIRTRFVARRLFDLTTTFKGKFDNARRIGFRVSSALVAYEPFYAIALIRSGGLHL